MTIKEYKDKFTELANQMEQEHGRFRNIIVTCENVEYGGTIDKSACVIVKKNVVIDF